MPEIRRHFFADKTPSPGKRRRPQRQWKDCATRFEGGGARAAKPLFYHNIPRGLRVRSVLAGVVGAFSARHAWDSNNDEAKSKLLFQQGPLKP